MKRHGMKLIGFSQRSGMTLVELAIMIGVTGMISVVGMRMVTAHLEQLIKAGSLATKESEFLRLQEQVQQAWDQRHDFIVFDEPWLQIETDNSVRGIALRKLRILSIDSKGQLFAFEWLKESDDWLIQSHGLADSVGANFEWRFAYSGEVLINHGEAQFVAGDAPERIHFQFPDAGQKHLRVGFAIGVDW